MLTDNAESWLTEYLADPSSDSVRYRYRHPEIKESLRQETGWKCVYCESKIGHNTPGDIEHKVPSSKNRRLHFDWSNLTVACTECNRRKLDYYKIGAEFLDPYSDPVEDCLIHLGPIVYWTPGHQRAEITVRTLSLDTFDRSALLQRKCDVLEKARALAELVASSPGDGLAALREDELHRMQDRDSEYSAMVSAYMLSCSRQRANAPTRSPTAKLTAPPASQ